MPQRPVPFRFDLPTPGPLRGVVNRIVGRILGLEALNRIYAALPPDAEPGAFVRAALDAMGITVEVNEGDLLRVPVAGSCVIVANHPFGGAEGLGLIDVLHRVRGDVRIFANRVLNCIPEMRALFLDVDVFAGTGAAAANAMTMRRAIRHLRGGGCLAAFPAGEVSSARLGRDVADPAWHEGVAAVARMAGAPVVPLRFEGSNGPLFHAAGMVHPALRTALLPRALLNRSSKAMRVRIGTLVPAERLAALPDDTARTALLRVRTDILGHRVDTIRVRGESDQVPLAPPECAGALAAEIAALSAPQCLAESANLAVYLATAPEVPTVMREIGRLRELSFRAVGEGTGRERDADRFDAYYLHLVLYDRAKRAIAGSYRLAPSEPVMKESGRVGLYTSTLFDLSCPFFARLGPALELGRSFVAPSYQRSFSSLMLLWKGIGAYVLAHPEIRTLFGPVSISARYSPAARQLIIEWLKSHVAATALMGAARARRPVKCARHVARAAGAAAQMLPDMDDLSDAVAEIEPALRGVPVLVREYHRLGGRYVAFSEDPAFGNVVDGLVVVDLALTDPRVLTRYMGKEGAGRFLSRHPESRNRSAPV